MKAFPSIDPVYKNDITELKVSFGMDLRDYFAAKAMETLVSSFLNKDLDEVDPHGWMEGVSSDAYRMADAMLKVRNEK